MTLAFTDICRQVNTSKEGSGEIKAVVHAPSGAMAELTSSRLDHHTHHIDFTPDEPGTWFDSSI